MKYEWPDFHYGSKRALYVRDDEGVMRRVGTYRNSNFITVAGKLYTKYEGGD